MSKASPLFAYLPRRLLWHPPIAHPGASHDEGTLTPFEFAVLAGTLVLARLSWTKQRHQRALQKGKDRIEVERGLHRQFKAQWRATNEARRQGQRATAPVREHTFHWPADRQGEPRYKSAMPLGKALKQAGSTGYRDSYRQQRRGPPPDRIVLSSSRNGLLRAAGLQKSAGNLGKLLAALERLCAPVRGAGEPQSPPLLGWGTVGRKLQLEVSGEWVQPPFGLVPLPLPLRGASLLSLYLFVWTIGKDDGSSSPKASNLVKLCERLGMPVCSPQFNASRSLERALLALNEHLDRLDARTLLRQHMEIPYAFVVVPVDDGLAVRLKAVAKEWQEWERDEAEASEPVEVSEILDRERQQPAAKKAKIPRLRLSPPEYKPRLVMSAEEERELWGLAAQGNPLAKRVLGMED
jgi:hypothetical protein